MNIKLFVRPFYGRLCAFVWVALLAGCSGAQHTSPLAPKGLHYLPGVMVAQLQRALPAQVPTVEQLNRQTPTYSITQGALPNGLTFDPSTGAIQGTPLQASAPTAVTVTVTTKGGSDSTVVSVAVNDSAPQFNYANAMVCPQFQSVSLMPTLTYASTGVSYALASPIPGVSVDPATGRVTCNISQWPGGLGALSAIVVASSPGNAPVSQPVSLQVIPAVPKIKYSNTLPAVVVGSTIPSFSATLDTGSGPVDHYELIDCTATRNAVDTAVPALNLSPFVSNAQFSQASGGLVGAPTSLFYPTNASITASFACNVKAVGPTYTGNAGRTGMASFNFGITAGLPICSYPASFGIVGQPFTLSPVIAAGSGPISSFSTTGLQTFNSIFSVATGVFSTSSFAVPMAGYSYGFGVNATGPGGTVACSGLTISTNPAIVFGNGNSWSGLKYTAALANSYVYQNFASYFSVNLAASSFPAGYTPSSQPFPAPMTVSSNGSIQGLTTGVSVGTSQYTVAFTGSGPAIQQVVSLTAYAPPLIEYPVDTQPNVITFHEGTGRVVQPISTGDYSTYSIASDSPVPLGPNFFLDANTGAITATSSVVAADSGVRKICLTSSRFSAVKDCKSYSFNVAGTPSLMITELDNSAGGLMQSVTVPNSGAINLVLGSLKQGPVPDYTFYVKVKNVGTAAASAVFASFTSNTGSTFSISAALPTSIAVGATAQLRIKALVQQVGNLAGTVSIAYEDVGVAKTPRAFNLQAVGLSKLTESVFSDAVPLATSKIIGGSCTLGAPVDISLLTKEMVVEDFGQSKRMYEGSSVALPITTFTATCNATQNAGEGVWQYNFQLNQVGIPTYGKFSLVMTQSQDLATMAQRDWFSAPNFSVIGAQHSCALTNKLNVKCWGAGGSGQLGSAVASAPITAPVTVPIADKIQMVAAGPYHTCALTIAGAVKCWGANSAGQLGNGTTTGSSSPVDVVGIVGTAIGIAVAEAHTCAVTAASEVYCWGDNTYGQLGSAPGTSPVPTNFTTAQHMTRTWPTSNSVSSIAASYRNSCLTLNTGRVYCVGDSYYGQVMDSNVASAGQCPLNNGGTIVQTCTGTMTPLGSATTYRGRYVTVGAYFACLQTESQPARGSDLVKCWGSAYNMRTGGGWGNISSPYAVSVTDVKKLVSGHMTSCVLTSTDEVKCWGIVDPVTYRFYVVNQPGFGSAPTALPISNQKLIDISTASIAFNSATGVSVQLETPICGTRSSGEISCMDTSGSAPVWSVVSLGN